MYFFCAVGAFQVLYVICSMCAMVFVDLLFVSDIFVVVVNFKFLLDNPFASGALCAVGHGQPQCYIQLHISLVQK